MAAQDEEHAEQSYTEQASHDVDSWLSGRWQHREREQAEHSDAEPFWFAGYFRISSVNKDYSQGSQEFIANSAHCSEGQCS